MARSKSRKSLALRRLYFSIDHAERSYWYGINHSNRNVWPEHFQEHDSVEVFGVIRHRYDKPIANIRLHLEPFRGPRDRRNTETNCIGAAWMEQKTTLYARAELPADAFYSVAECLGRGGFKEVSVTLVDWKRSGARVDGFCMEPALTPEDDLCVI